MSEYPKRLHVPLTNAQHAAVKLLAERTGRPIAHIARTAIVREVKAELSQIAKKEPKKGV